MHFTTSLLATVLLASAAIASPVVARHKDQKGTSTDMDGHDMDDSYNIFKNSNERYEGAICKDQITTSKFPDLMVPNKQSGCVRYYQGIDMTGVVTEVDLYAKDGINSACDCIAKCLSSPLTCTNWVYKHTFVPSLDGGKRSCTLYSSPNLPTDVTLAYNLNSSTGFNLLRPINNPQAGGSAPLTFRDAANTVQDPYGVSGFMTQDSNGKQYC